MLRYWLEYIPFIILATIVRLLPRTTALGFGRKLGKLGMLLQPKRVKIADNNLRHAFPDKTEEERELLVKQVFNDMGLGLIEMVRLDMFDGKKDLEKFFTFEGEEFLKEALSLGKGCILLTGHLGFWEAGNFVFPILGIPTGIVAKPMRNPLVDAYFRRMRQHYGGYIIDSHKGARRIFKALKKNHAVGILMDQHMPRSKSAVRVPFFGRPDYTTQIIAHIEIKYQVPIIPFFCYRKNDNTYLVKASAPFFLDTETSDDSITANTSLLTQKIEEGIRRDVSQWFWVHRRWKHMKQHEK
jgi:KDO2-lipid IV(A) lauroyltransferase